MGIVRASDRVGRFGPHFSCDPKRAFLTHADRLRHVFEGGRQGTRPFMLTSSWSCLCDRPDVLENGPDDNRRKHAGSSCRLLRGKGHCAPRLPLCHAEACSAASPRFTTVKASFVGPEYAKGSGRGCCSFRWIRECRSRPAPKDDRSRSAPGASGRCWRVSQEQTLVSNTRTGLGAASPLPSTAHDHEHVSLLCPRQ